MQWSHDVKGWRVYLDSDQSDCSFGTGLRHTPCLHGWELHTFRWKTGGEVASLLNTRLNEFWNRDIWMVSVYKQGVYRQRGAVSWIQWNEFYIPGLGWPSQRIFSCGMVQDVWRRVVLHLFHYVHRGKVCMCPLILQRWILNSDNDPVVKLPQMATDGRRGVNSLPVFNALTLVQLLQNNISLVEESWVEVWNSVAWIGR